MKRIRAMVATLLLLVSLGLCGCSLLPELAPSDPPSYDMTPKVGGDALITPGTLVVGVDTSKAPFAGESYGHIVGIDVDLAAALGDELGLKIKIVDVAEKGGPTALEDGDIDLFFAFDKNTASHFDCTFTGTYLYDAAALFTRDGSYGINKVEHLPEGAYVAVQRNTTTAESAYVLYGADVVVETDTLADAFSALANGEVQYVAASAVVGNYIAYTQYSDVVMVGVLDEPRAIGLGVKSSNKELAKAAGEAMETLKNNGIADLMIDKWLGANLELLDEPVVPVEPVDANATDANGTEEGNGTEEASS